MLEKLKPNDCGEFIDNEGVTWTTRSDYLMCGVLPSCGCGDPESIGRYVYDMLKKHVAQGFEDYTCWENTNYEDLPVMFFLSWAETEGYIAHGSTIRCSWMTAKGRELMKDLETILESKDIDIIGTGEQK